MKKAGKVISMKAALKAQIAAVKRDIKRLELEKSAQQKELERLRKIAERGEK